MNTNPRVWYLSMSLINHILIGAVESCENLVSQILPDVYPSGVSDDDVNFRESCDSQVGCLQLCSRHRGQCDVALWDRGNGTCGLVCVSVQAQFQTRTGVTSLLNVGHPQQDYWFVEGRLVYPIVGGLTLGRVVHIYARYKTLNNAYDVFLVNANKNNLPFYCAMEYHQNRIIMNTCTNQNPATFPSYGGGQWGSDQVESLPPSQTGDQFEIQIFAKSASEFGLRFDDNYEVSLSNRVNTPLEDITWLVMTDAAEHVNMEHLCIW